MRKLIQIQVVSRMEMFTASEKAVKDVASILCDNGFRPLRFCTFEDKKPWLRLPLVFKEMVKLFFKIPFRADIFMQYPFSRFIYVILPPPISGEKGAAAMPCA